MHKLNNDWTITDKWLKHCSAVMHKPRNKYRGYIIFPKASIFSYYQHFSGWQCIRWSQVAIFMWNFHRNSAKYRTMLLVQGKYLALAFWWWYKYIGNIRIFALCIWSWVNEHSILVENWKKGIAKLLGKIKKFLNIHFIYIYMKLKHE